MPDADNSVAFESTEPFAFFDYFRVPYRVVAGQDLGRGGKLGLLWPMPSAAGTLRWMCAYSRVSRFELAGMQLAGCVATDEDVRREYAIDDGAGGWSPTEPITGSDGRRLGSVWRHEDGNVLLPFDPGEVMTTLWSERYREADRSALRAAIARTALRGYYLLRPVLPRPVQLALRRAFTPIQARTTFPRWPVEDGLHELYRWLFKLLGELSGRPVPWLDLWPHGRSWTLVLTHDVETAAGLRQRELLRGPERELGLCSSWNLVAERYAVDDDFVRSLREDGCEVGVHGLRHDGKDLGSSRLLRARLPAMRRAAQCWGAVGFRSPATHRRWEWMPLLGFDYDSSYPDTDRYEPQPGGCCTMLPFFNGEMVELPITLPQDHTLFALLGCSDGGLWQEKVRHIREHGGMALVLTHPDYASNSALADAYRELISSVHRDPTLWHALPRDVAGWWRQRAASSLRGSADGWQIIGPASGAGRVRLGPITAPPRAALTATD
jgi:hypothetical protein